MRLLANENFPDDAIIALRDVGHDAVGNRTEAPGSSNRDVLAWTHRENRILITFDKDFGELAFEPVCPLLAVLSCFVFPPLRPSV
jgi:predicted nuclease of predicted toxin-antitoxin system